MVCRSTTLGCWGCGRPWDQLRFEPLCYGPTDTGYYCPWCDVYSKQVSTVPIGADAEGFPILPAWPRKEPLNSVVWCTHCLRWHLHGYGDGHRVAHCHVEGSYPKGYILQTVGTITTRAMQSYARDESRRVKALARAASRRRTP
jgi:hypothetical protein